MNQILKIYTLNPYQSLILSYNPKYKVLKRPSVIKIKLKF